MKNTNSICMEIQLYFKNDINQQSYLTHILGNIEWTDNQKRYRSQSCSGQVKQVRKTLFKAITMEQQEFLKQNSL